MPTYHSTFNEHQGDKICNTVLLPLKTKIKGPAPPGRSDEPDIVDEAIKFFRANVLFRKYESKGPADLTLCYLTILISEILRVFAGNQAKDRNSAEKKLLEISLKTNFAIPGDTGFSLAGFFTAPAARSEGEKCRSYFKQLREETCARMLDFGYLADGSRNKWWCQFSKRKFMNIAIA